MLIEVEVTPLNFIVKRTVYEVLMVSRLKLSPSIVYYSTRSLKYHHRISSILME